MTKNLEFTEVSVCPYCGALAEERGFGGNDGATFCSDGCGCIEGEGSVTKFVCPHCEELCDDEKCDCTTKE